MIFRKSLLKTSEVAEMFNVAPSTVFLWVKAGRLRPRRTLGGNFRFRRDAVERLIDGRDRQSAGGVNLRREERLPARFPARVESVAAGAGATGFSAQVTDLSAHGAGLLIFDPVNFLQEYQDGLLRELTILNPGHQFLKASVQGRIAHARPLADGSLAVGVELLAA